MRQLILTAALMLLCAHTLGEVTPTGKDSPSGPPTRKDSPSGPPTSKDSPSGPSTSKSSQPKTPTSKDSPREPPIIKETPTRKETPASKDVPTDTPTSKPSPPQVPTNKTATLPPPDSPFKPEEQDPVELETWSNIRKPESEITYPPTVTLVLLVRNKAHSLPNFLAFIDRLDYPRDRMSIFLRSDHNIDNSTYILKEWIENVRFFYHDVNVVLNATEGGYPEEKSTMDWPDERMGFLMTLRQEGLQYARSIWSDYVFFIDADNLLENSQVLTTLMRHRKTVIAPMLISLGRYSNWWGDMTENLYYLRSADYMDILNREKVGLFQVPMVHSTFLVDLRRSESRFLSYAINREAYKAKPIPFDDIIVFAYNARANGVKFWLSNEEAFGKLIGPLADTYGVEDDMNQYTNMKLESLFEDPAMPVSEFISFIPSVKTKLGFDQIYLVNLKRRPDRLQRMQACFEELGIDYKLIEAVDGKQLTKNYLEALDIKQCANYKDPYSGRDLTYGEIGCFMSHYKIWEDVVQNSHQKVIVFEDDIRFETFFKIALNNVMIDLHNSGVDNWDMIYLGRKRLRKDLEPTVKDTVNLVWPSYSYWTLSYILSISGAQKLLNQRPLNRLVPVDEYLPIMFDKHPSEEWKKNFTPRDLVALSADPLLCFPTHYTGEANYISDTEESDVIPDEHVLLGAPGSENGDPQQQAQQQISAHHKTAKSMYAEASTDHKVGREEL